MRPWTLPVVENENSHSHKNPAADKTICGGIFIDKKRDYSAAMAV